MVALRIRPAAALSGPFWLSVFCAAFAPTAVGYQDLAAFFVRQPGVSERWHEHLIASPFGTIHAATFRFSRPIGTAMPEPMGAQPVNFDPHSLDVKAWSAGEPLMTQSALQIEYPTVNRRLKGDRMPLPQHAPDVEKPAGLLPLQPIDAPAARPASPPTPVTGPRPKTVEQRDVGPAAAPANSSAADTSGVVRDADAEDAIAAADKPPEIPAAGAGDPLEAAPSPFASLSFVEEDAAERDAQLYFSVATMGSRGGLEQWGPGAAPVPASPAIDPEIKLSALEGQADGGVGGETIAGKDDAALRKSPAQRLGLAGKPRAKAERCLADAVYFEARGEPLRGQMAVAQVVMNRVFSGYYPNDVCGVVYQNANRHLACQFTFACDGTPDVVDEPDMWAQAKRIAKDTLDGKIWLAEVGHATHYHAYWVHPSWVHEMKKMYKLGVHTFYRPRAWGDGSDAPIWGDVPATSKPAAATSENPEAESEPPAITKSPQATVKIPQTAVSSSAPSPVDKRASTAKL